MFASKIERIHAVFQRNLALMAPELHPSVNPNDKEKLGLQLIYFMRDGRGSLDFFLDLVKTSQRDSPFNRKLDEHPNYVASFLKANRALYDKNDYKLVHEVKTDIIKFHKKSPADIIDFLLDNSKQVVRKSRDFSYVSYANLQLALGEFEIAKTSYGEGFAKRVAAVGIHKPEVVTLIRHCAACDFFQNRFENALALSRKALDISSQDSGNSLTMSLIFNEIAETLTKLNRLEEADHARSQALEAEKIQLVKNFKIADEDYLNRLLSQKENFDISKVAKLNKKSWQLGGEEYLKEASKPKPYAAFIESHHTKIHRNKIIPLGKKNNE